MKSEFLFVIKGNGGGMSNETTPTLVGDHQNRITDFTAIIVEVKADDTDE